MVGSSFGPSAATIEHRLVAGSRSVRRDPGSQVPQRHASSSRDVGGVQFHDVGSHPGLELARSTLSDHAAIVDDDYRRGEMIGFVEVLRREDDVGTVIAQHLDVVPYLVATRRIESGRGLVQQEQTRRSDEAGTEVEAIRIPPE